ncbi:isoprenyl transferase [Verrucomicrobiales bacterium]|jgi:undecaprenyl diphosphate synthase|nr:isoprenyl transferase [Verrucomicrobiales bacterium]
MSDKAENVPEHIAIIMDGNGRWAKERGLPRVQGHRAGAESVREAVAACSELGVKYLTLYAFSSENWNRPKAEVDALMKLLERFLKDKTPEILSKNVRLQAIGRIDLLPESCRKQLNKSIESSAENDGLTLILALSYGGREEIIDGVKSVLRAVQDGHIDEAMITPELFDSHLYTRYFPDPDLMIRTSGEMRISNFLLWQLSYSEFYVTRKNWPDFRRNDLEEAIAEYNRRHRRYGKL